MEISIKNEKKDNKFKNLHANLKVFTPELTYNI